jgi:hypothetical protein
LQYRSRTDGKPEGMPRYKLASPPSGVFGAEFLVLVGMRGRMHEFVVNTLSATRWRKVFAFNARHFESCRTIAFFNDLVDAGSFDNAAGLMDFGHLTPLGKWLCTFSKGHADRGDLSILVKPLRYRL